ncbi:uncharacterized protein LOC104887860 isoform X1 [Beta vulgaris subsp. vulgaris]|uniref:uncharacterized protein LOC104887860 isoform X1 n=2 Tax=Beta vulgaris subsp. vulgaris TaxID=3555 RepID=UPI0020369AF2|nr:uncharacterized protein LOC104887860 isoform X1 [Beta vulgaris subsp. vulgaris]
MRFAVIGGGISGLGAAFELAKAGVEVVLYEKEELLGGHAQIVNVNGIDVDLNFMVFNRVSYPHTAELFDGLGIDVDAFDMSVSVSLDKGQGCEWGSRNGFRSLLAQTTNALKPNFWRMVQEIKKFKDDVIMYLDGLELNPEIDRAETFGHFIKSRSYSELFQKAYLIPVFASFWCCSSERVMDFSAFSVLSFCRNHHLLELSAGPQWLSVSGGSQQYVNKLREELEVRGSQIRTSCEVNFVSTSDKGCALLYGDGSEDLYDGCIIAVPAPNALKILGKEATDDETRILGALQYVGRDIFLHRDKKFMPQNPAAWSALNFQGSTDNTVCLTYWINVLQNISKTDQPLLLTINPPHPPENFLLKRSTGVLVPSVASMKASLELRNIQGKRGIWFCGTRHGNGFHEDGLKAGLIAANDVLKRTFLPLPNPKKMALSWTEATARRYIIRYLKSFISAGCLLLLEDGGTVLKFEGSDKRCTWKTAIRVHNPQFYWKVALEADLGLADAFINGDISIVDKDDGLLDLFRIFLANMYLYRCVSMDEKKSFDFKGWWTPMFFTAGIASAKYFYQHLSRKNSVTLARRNIARHYDLSNEMFSLFLDDTMTYSCAVFKSEDEDLKVAQLRKLHLLIEKARVEKQHEVLDIGCGWGSLAIEIVKKTGCRYTGITLAEEQLKLAEQRVKEAGLQDHIKFLLCDYRQLPASHKFDRIISCGMLEHVGDEYYEDFFRHCESLLADTGLLVLQTISIPDERYDGHKKSSDFMREYIFPGGCLPSLSRLTTAMASASRLCVEHVENIGVHYGQALRCWRKNFLENQGKIRSLGFDDKFMRAWEYYFDYMASMFKTRTLGDYQIVFSRQGNLVAFSDPYECIPSSHSFP